MQKQIFLFLVLILILSCQNNSETPEGQPTVEVESSSTIKNEKVILTTAIDHLRVRDKAGKEGETLKMLKNGEQVIYLNEKSDFKDAVTLRGIRYEEPWLKIQLSPCVRRVQSRHNPIQVDPNAG